MQSNFEYYFSLEEFHFKAVSNSNSIKSLGFEENASLNNIDQIPDILIECQKQLKLFFEGKLNNFDLKLDPEGTDFQKKVWEQLQQIPYGSTMTYAEVAHKLGDVKVIRAAATANGKNPITIIIPCHRVVGTNGKLTGYAWGLHIKKHILNLENRIANGALSLF